MNYVHSKLCLRILITSVLCFLRVIATEALKSIARAIASCPALQFCYIVYAFHDICRGAVFKALKDYSLCSTEFVDLLFSFY